MRGANLRPWNKVGSPVCECSSGSFPNRTRLSWMHGRRGGDTYRRQSAGHCEHQPSRCLTNHGCLDTTFTGKDNPAYELKHLRMLYLPNGLLKTIWKSKEAATGERVSEIIFPSRHVAASGQPSLPSIQLCTSPTGGGTRPYGGHGGHALLHLLA